MKKCTDCNRNLPLTNFSIKNNSTDGLQYVCKKCRSKTYFMSRNGRYNFRIKDSGKKCCNSCHVVKDDADFPKGRYVCKRCIDSFDFTGIEFYQKFDIVIDVDNAYYHFVTDKIESKIQLRKFIQTHVPDITGEKRGNGYHEQGEFKILLISPAQKDFRKLLKANNKKEWNFIKKGGYPKVFIDDIIQKRRKKEKITGFYRKY